MGIIGNFVNKCLSLVRLGKKWFEKLISGIVEAARTISYVETVNPSQTDTLHKEIKKCNSRDMANAFGEEVKSILPKLHLGKVKLGVDVTEDLTWGKHEVANMRPSAYEHGIQSWQFLNICIVEPYYIPLLSLPYRQVDNLDDLVIELLEYVDTLGLNVERILFDRGFYHAYLINYLNNPRRQKSWPYLIFIRRTKAVKSYIDQTQHFDVFDHEFSQSKGKTKIVVWKPDYVVNENVAWPFATNHQRPSIGLLDEYPIRWNQETGFRTHDEGKIKSKSNKMLVRYFYHLVGMLLIILWRLQNTNKNHTVFKRYLKYVEANIKIDLPTRPPPKVVI